MKRGEMSFALMIVVAAIVIIVVALVMLTIFGNSMVQVGSIASVESSCRMTAESTCRTSNAPPLDWNTPKAVSVNGKTELRTCAQLVGTCPCENYILKTCIPITVEHS
jgi:spore coat protein U-like protein